MSSVKQEKRKHTGRLATRQPPAARPASLTSPGAVLPHWPREDGAQDPAGPALGASGDLCCRGVGPDAGEGESRDEPGRGRWDQPRGPQGALQQRDKAVR